MMFVTSDAQYDLCYDRIIFIEENSYKRLSMITGQQQKVVAHQIAITDMDIFARFKTQQLIDKYDFYDIFVTQHKYTI